MMYVYADKSNGTLVQATYSMQLLILALSGYVLVFYTAGPWSVEASILNTWYSIWFVTAVAVAIDCTNYK